MKQEKRKRKAISKGRRFDIFTRDGFKCRYCGKTSVETTLVIDHVIPFSKGGSEDDDNLVTSCQACNAGKLNKSLERSSVPEDIRLRIEQERKEVISAARRARAAAKAALELRQEIVNYWCMEKGTREMERTTLNIMVSFASQYGPEIVFNWISIAMDRIGRHKKDSDLGRYVCGIRKKVMEQEGAGK